MIRTNILIIMILLFCATMVGCSKSEDVSTNPKFGNFIDVTGVWKTKVDLYLCPVSDSNDLLDLSSNTMFSNNNNGSLATIPLGSEIEVANLIEVSTIDVTLYRIIGSVVSGPYAGRKLRLDTRLFIRNAMIAPGNGPYPLGETGWGVNPEKLERPSGEGRKRG